MEAPKNLQSMYLKDKLLKFRTSLLGSSVVKNSQEPRRGEIFVGPKGRNEVLVLPPAHGI